MNINMDTFLHLLNTLGLSSYFVSIMLYTTHIFCGINWDKTIAFVMSILGLIYIILKIIDAIMDIRKKRKKQ